MTGMGSKKDREDFDDGVLEVKSSNNSGSFDQQFVNARAFNPNIVKGYAHTILPLEEPIHKKFNDKETIGKKLIIVPAFKDISPNKFDECDSPLMKQSRLEEIKLKKATSEEL